MSRTAAYWREVSQKAWALSKEHFAWLYPIVAGLVTFVLQWLVLGWKRAVEDLTPALIAAAATVIVAIVVYVVNVLRAVYQVHVEQLSSITKIERERDAVRAEIVRQKDEAEERRRIGMRLVAFHVAGARLVDQIVASDDTTSFTHWADIVRDYIVEVTQFIKAEISPAKAAYIDETPSSFMAIDRIGMGSVKTKEEKTRLLQRLEHRLSKLAALMGEY